MARIICIASGKGGVGKTTLTANLATALSLIGKSVVAVDGNLTTSNLGLHLGIPLYPVTLQDVINREATVRDALHYHTNGFNVIPADISVTKIMSAKAHHLMGVLYKLLDEAEFVLIDSSAGLGKEATAAVEAADEMITITTPDLPSVTDALKLIHLAEKFNTENIGVVVNRYKKGSHQFTPDDVREFLDAPLIGVVPEDDNMHKALAYKEPIISLNPRSRSSREFMAIAAAVAGERHRPMRGWNITDVLFGWLR